ncbi:MAG: hypothetical protein FWD22_04370 [Treponema sp.]|nr:hypothetical protein [Treponema sp.]
MFSLRILKKRGVSCVLALVLGASLLFMGCPPDPDDEDLTSLLHGTWISQFDEKFVIDLNNNTIQHDYIGNYPDFCFSGTIHEIVKLTNNGSAGIIFIEYTNKAGWWGTGDGNFTGVYYNNLTDTTIVIANASEEFPPGEYITPTTTTLAAAKARFTEGTIYDYFQWTSPCIKQ